MLHFSEQAQIKISNPKLQITNKLQLPKYKIPNGIRSFLIIASNKYAMLSHVSWKV
jgi:hypothetical protein